MSTPGENLTFTPSPGVDASAGVTEVLTPNTMPAGVTDQVSTPDAINGDEPSPHRDSLLEAISGVVEVTDHGEDDFDPSDPSSMAEAPGNQPEGEAPSEAAAPAESETETADATAAGSETADDEDDTADDFPENHGDMPNGFRERLQKLQRQRDEARAQAAERQAQLDQQAETPAPFGEVTGFIQEHQLPPEAVQQGLNIMAAWKYGDMESFLKGVGPLVQHAQQALGLSLPADLQEQVNQGYTTLDVARELAQSRARGQATEARLRETQTQAAQQAETNRRNVIVSAIGNWETRQKQSDPDFAKKEEQVRLHARAIMAERGAPPATEAEAIAVADEALKRANAYIASLAPAAPVREIRPTGPTSSVSSTVPVSSKPTSLMDAAMKGLGAAHSRDL